MNTRELRSYLNRLFIDHVDICSVDTLPAHRNSSTLFIVNTASSNLSGNHWIAIMVRQKNGYVFDSFGQIPPSEISHWLNLRGYNWSTNQRRVQSYMTETCGLFCLYFLFFATSKTLENESYDRIMDILFPLKASINSYEKFVQEFANLFG